MSPSRRLALGSPVVALVGCGAGSAPPAAGPTAPVTPVAPSPSPTPTGVITLTAESFVATLKQASASGATSPPTLTCHYRVDAAGLVRRVAYDALGTSTQMTFAGWGEPPDIHAPAADQIANLDRS